MGNFFCCCRSVEDQFDDVILVQAKINLAGKVGEGETTSRTENKCQAKTELEQSTSGMQKEENQETTNVFENSSTKFDKEKVLLDNLDAKQKESSLEKPCSNEELLELVQTEVKENSSSEETQEVDVANVVAEPEIDDGAKKMNLSNEEDFQAEKNDSSVETNIVGESGFDGEMKDQPQETELANGAEKMSQLRKVFHLQKSVSLLRALLAQKLKTNHRKLSQSMNFLYEHMFLY